MYGTLRDRNQAWGQILSLINNSVAGSHRLFYFMEISNSNCLSNETFLAQRCSIRPLYDCVTAKPAVTSQVEIMERTPWIIRIGMLNRLRLYSLRSVTTAAQKKAFRSGDSMETSQGLYLRCVVGRMCPLLAIRREQKGPFPPSVD